MSLPLKRRIARAALLVAADAEPAPRQITGAAAAEQTTTPELSGLTSLDKTAVDHAVQGASHKANDLATEAAGPTVARALPEAGKAARKGGRALDPVTRKVASDTGSTAAHTLDKTTRTLQGHDGLPTPDQLAGNLPLGS
jgi:hypothetical protein